MRVRELPHGAVLFEEPDTAIYGESFSTHYPLEPFSEDESSSRFAHSTTGDTRCPSQTGQQARRACWLSQTARCGRSYRERAFKRTANPKGVLHTDVALTRPLKWIAKVDFAAPKTARAQIAAEFEGWAPALTALITEGETDAVLRTIHTLPDAHRWERVPGVTLLGDAAHMPPSGEGANLAMYDGATRGVALAAHPRAQATTARGDGSVDDLTFAERRPGRIGAPTR